ncbi:MAG: SAM-dependent methyltransferase [Defluviitaleaceae bacterium]|nr:SAM-dependent methyltransferase [Defluviitaleaceae bacterium]
MNWIKFAKQYITKPRSIGAIAPSSRFLARKMVATIDFDKARCIVEFGPGTGVFTDRILHRRNTETVVIIIERNGDFCDALHRKYKDTPNLHIINGSAERIGTYLAERGIPRADYIVSGLPFASLPKEVSGSILTQTRKYLHDEGRFITFQYTLIRKDLISRHFGSIQITREIRNLPPAYVLSCKKNPPI